MEVHRMGSWQMSKFCDVSALRWKNTKMDNLIGINKALQDSDI